GTDTGDPKLVAFRVVGALEAGAYRLVVHDGGEMVTLPFVVSDLPDLEAPQALALDLRPFDGRLEVSVDASEPVFARLLTGNDPGVLRPRPWRGFGRSLTLREESLADGTSLWVRVELRDVAGASSLDPPADRAPRAVRI